MQSGEGKIAGAADVGGTNTRVGLVREDGKIIRIEKFPTPVQGKPGDIPLAIASTLLEIADGIPLAGLGVAAAGPINAREGYLDHPPNIPFNIVPITAPLKEAIRLPVTFRNDCRAAVLGEICAGGARGYDNVVYITISTGIGGGVFTNGRVITGRGGNAGEIGHFPVDTTYNLPCTCGLYGHWEGYASGRGIPIFFREWCTVHDLPCAEMTTPGILRLTAEDIRYSGFRDALAKVNGRGLSTVIAAYDPECIILDGTVIQSNPDLLDQALMCTDRYLDLPVCLLSPLNGDAPLIGAAMTVFHPEMI
ncbi:MAG TPA: ROK family protein [Methanospirillum sp.]|jgi:glucokinase|uniref:ROK family protein n=1 Tax=Methanospirillum sp. TaxID=45200 RepID=UPI002B896D8A|nr:ROK family protein [Methanospirillum sp.]HPY59324.1 ROK family protein [Methanospirillum sp.]